MSGLKGGAKHLIRRSTSEWVRRKCSTPVKLKSRSESVNVRKGKSLIKPLPSVENIKDEVEQVDLETGRQKLCDHATAGESGDNAEEIEFVQETVAETASQEISNKVEMVEIPNFSTHQATSLLMDGEGSLARGSGEIEVTLPLDRDGEVMEVAVQALKGGFNFPEAEKDEENNVLGNVKDTKRVICEKTKLLKRLKFAKDMKKNQLEDLKAEAGTWEMKIR